MISSYDLYCNKIFTRHKTLIQNTTNLVVTLERLEVVESADGRGVSHPLQRLPVGDDPHIFHLVDEVQEHDEALLVVGLCEPRCVVVETEGSPEIIWTFG